DGWDITAPTFRVDLVREVDMIEEVGRHYGFDKLEATFPPLTEPAPPPDPRIARDQLVRRVLTAAGISETVTFGFIEAVAAGLFLSTGTQNAQNAGRSQSPLASARSASSADSANSADSALPGLVSIANPLSKLFDTLRPSLLPGLVDAVAHN